MPTITLRLTNTEYNIIKDLCDKEGIAISSYIKRNLFPQQKEKRNYLTNEIIVSKIKERITRINNNEKLSDTFVLSELFNDEEYTQYYNFIPAGKTFFKYASTPGTEAYDLVDALGGKPAKYLIRKDVLKDSK